MLVMYHPKKGEENIDVVKCAANHQKLLGDWFKEQTKGWKAPLEGRKLDIELDLRILTAADLPAPPPKIDLDDIPIDLPETVFKERMAAYDKYRAYLWLYDNNAGFFKHFNLTAQPGRSYYDCRDLPSEDPQWATATYVEILAHEVLGHGLGCVDEYNLSVVDRPWCDLFVQYDKTGPGKEALMGAPDRAKKGHQKFLMRYLNPALYGKSNHPYAGSNQDILSDMNYDLRNHIIRFGDTKHEKFTYDPQYLWNEVLRILGRQTK